MPGSFSLHFFFFKTDRLDLNVEAAFTLWWNGIWNESYMNCGYEIKWSYDLRSYERNFYIVVQQNQTDVEANFNVEVVFAIIIINCVYTLKFFESMTSEFPRSTPLRSNRSVLNFSKGGPWNSKLTLKVNRIWTKIKAKIFDSQVLN